MDIDLVRNEFNRIKSLGFIISDKPDAKNDGVVGNTFETAVGVKENNLREADWRGWEFKTQRQFTKSASSLFTSKPDYPLGGDEYMRQNWGVNDPSGEYPHIKVFRTSIYANRWATVYEKYKMKLEVDEDNEKLKIILCDLNEEVIDNSVYWSFDTLRSASKKLKNTLVLKAEEALINNKVHFKYISAKAYVNFNFNALIELIKNGEARYDNRLGIYRSGKNKGKKHNHGGGIRLVKSASYNKLFEKSFEC